MKPMMDNETQQMPWLSKESPDFIAGYLVGKIPMSFSTEYLCRMSPKTVKPADFVLSDFELGLLTGARLNYAKTRRRRLDSIFKKLAGRLDRVTMTSGCTTCKGTGALRSGYPGSNGVTYSCWDCDGKGVRTVQKAVKL